MAEWLLLVYRLPTEPSAPRVATWRALKRLDGTYLQDGTYLIEHSDAHELELHNLQHDIENYGGTAVVFRVQHTQDPENLRRFLAGLDTPSDDRPPARKRKTAARTKRRSR